MVRPGKRKPLNKQNAANALIDKTEKLKASICGEVEHPFRVVMRLFGHARVRYRGLNKNTQQLVTLSALSSLWMARSKLMGGGAQVHLKMEESVQQGAKATKTPVKTTGFVRACP